MNTSEITISYHGAIITVKSADEAVQIAQRLTGVMPASNAVATNGTKPSQPIPNAMRPKRQPPRDALEYARDLLTAISNAPREGLGPVGAMEALKTTDTKGFGGRVGKVNVALRDLGFQPHRVYLTARGDGGKYRKPGRLLEPALAVVMKALAA